MCAHTHTHTASQSIQRKRVVMKNVQGFKLNEVRWIRIVCPEWYALVLHWCLVAFDGLLVRRRLILCSLVDASALHSQSAQCTFHSIKWLCVRRCVRINESCTLLIRNRNSVFRAENERIPFGKLSWPLIFRLKTVVCRSFIVCS